MTLTGIGRVVRLQIQRESLKQGSARARYYDPAPIAAVERLMLTNEGVAACGPDGAEQIDVHNARHPASKNREINPVSVGFTAHYAAMRRRFGEHVTDGIAGENILVESERLFALEDLEGGVVILGDDGRRVELSSASVAHPCVEFSRHALGNPDATPLVVSQALRFLDNGVRGFYCCLESPRGTEVRLGDRVFVADRSRPPGGGLGT
jgi:hypothetical protein